MNTEIQERQYRYSKEVYLNVKNWLKDKAQEQRVLKQKRKPVRNPDMFDPDARWTHLRNRNRIRHAYIVYDYIRGKDDRVQEAKKREDFNQLLYEVIKKELVNKTKTL